MLHALHQHLRGRASERAIWDAVVAVLDRPLPAEVAHDLLDRRVAIDALMPSRQQDEVQWRMARELGEEAALTLAFEYHRDPGRSTEEFRALLQEFADDSWMLRGLVDRWASSPEKEAAYREVIERPDAPEDARDFYWGRRMGELYSDPVVGAAEFAERLATVASESVLLELNRVESSSPEKERAYRHLVAACPRSEEFRRRYGAERLVLYYTRERYSVEELRNLLAERVDDEETLAQLHEQTPRPPEKREAYLDVLAQRPRAGRLQQILEARRQWVRAADASLGEQEIRALFATNDTGTLLELARNPGTPDDLLREMAGYRERPGARQIRPAALGTLRHRENMARREAALRRRAGAVEAEGR